jgi:predicted transcriptional regulator
MQVIADVLRAIEKEGGVCKPTHILYKANLSHKLLKEHLNLLIKKGFVEIVLEDNRTLYKITDEGRKFMGEFRKIEKMAQMFGLPV